MRLTGKKKIHRIGLEGLGACDNCRLSLSKRKTAQEYTVNEWNYTQIFHPGKCFEAGTERMINFCFKEAKKKNPQTNEDSVLFFN